MGRFGRREGEHGDGRPLPEGRIRVGGLAEGMDIDIPPVAARGPPPRGPGGRFGPGGPPAPHGPPYDRRMPPPFEFRVPPLPFRCVLPTRNGCAAAQGPWVALGP
jgi:hypothetical protein